MTSVAEIERRHAAARGAMEREGLDVLIVSGSEYTGFDGAVFYMSGFQIVHRYAYVLIPLEGEPAIVFPSEARFVGEHDESWLEDVAVVGVTSGASAPEKLVERLCDWFRARGTAEIEAYRLVEEDVEFRLPVELRRELALAEAQD